MPRLLDGFKNGCLKCVQAAFLIGYDVAFIQNSKIKDKVIQID